MSNVNLKRIIIFCFLILTLTVTCVLGQIPVLSKKISIQVSNKEIPYVLDLISKQAKVDFTYNSAIFSNRKVISYSGTNKTIEEVLRNIFNDPSIQYKVKGNQIILYKSNTQAKATTDVQLIKGVPIVIDSSFKNDFKTIKVYDTVITIYYDTLKIIDTVVVFDTIYKEIIKSSSIKYISSVGFNVFSQYEIYNKFNPNIPSFKSYSEFLNRKLEPAIYYGISADYNLERKNWELSTGIDYSVLKRKVYFNEKISEIIKTIILKDTFYYRVDTLDKYCKQYKDTLIWFYITDSSKINSKITIIDYDTFSSTKEKSTINKSTFVSFPLMLGYNFTLNENTTLFFKGGVIANLLLSSKGVLYSSSNFELVDKIVIQDQRKIFFSMLFETGILHKLNETTFLNLNLSYISNLNSPYLDSFPVNHFFLCLACNTGVKFYL